MKKRISILAAVLTLAFLMLATVFASDIVVVFESDVHCAIDGYAKIASVQMEESKKGNAAFIVSAGDYVQGGTIGAFSKGRYIVDIMNEVGYDVVTLGNHEFDYSIPNLHELMQNLDADVVSANFISVESGERLYAPYVIKEAFDKKIAFVGITTPESITKATPSDFMNEDGEYIYDFCGENLYETVQNAVDEARNDGADYVIALSHLGTEGVTEKWSAQEIIKNTSGIDVVIDGHSHSLIESAAFTNKDGKDVLISSVGTKFENIGKIRIAEDGTVSASLLKTEEITQTDAEVAAKIEEINAEYKAEGDKVIGKSDVDFKLNDDAGNRLVRVKEVTLGNFIADAYRAVFDADIGMMNGGGIRADVAKGDITYNDLLEVLPWENTVCVASVSGQTILDILEMSVSSYPEELGAFQHVSGIKFAFDPAVASSVKFDDKGMFSSIDGERRVKEVLVFNKETQSYEPINPEKMYTLASISYFLKENGDGNTLTSADDIVVDADMIDTSVVREYINDYLGGTIGAEYAETEGRITLVDSKITASENEQRAENKSENENTADNKDSGFPVTAVVIASVAVIVVLVFVVIAVKKKKSLDK